VYLEQMLDQNLFFVFSNERMNSFLHPNYSLTLCYLSKEAIKWFGLKSEEDCLTTREGLSEGDRKPVIRFYSELQKKWVGVLSDFRLDSVDVHARPGAVLQITPEQTLFNDMETGGGLMLGPVIASDSGTATYRNLGSTVDSVGRAVRYSATPDTFTLAGVSGTDVISLVTYRSHLSLLTSLRSRHEP